MPTVTNGDAVIHYESFGEGPPVLALAPGGLRMSRIEAWQNAPWNPLEALAGRFQVVGMDQRNTGGDTSRGPITAGTGWSTYAHDQIAVIDALGIDTFSVIGMCIGGAFILQLLSEFRERVRCAVALQPIGLHDNRDAFRGIFEQWRSQIAGDHPEADDAAWEGAWANLFGGDNTLWSVPDDELPAITAPILVCLGNDTYHPPEASRLLASTAPNATLIERWKEPDVVAEAQAAVVDFLAEHA